jgi:N-acetylmuramoyl-L-alanine amidase
MRPYVVRQGEYLGLLAARMSFDADEVWQDATNAALRERRGAHDVLCAGDVVYLPDDPPAPQTVRARSSNAYRGRVPRVPVSVRLTVDGEALTNASCVLEGLHPPATATTDGEGVLRFDAPMSTDEVTAVFRETGASFRILVGHLDPHDTDSGVFDRLVNLGYAADHDRRAGDEARAGAQASALERFQRDHDLEPTGRLDDATRDALRDAHGR